MKQDISLTNKYLQRDLFTFHAWLGQKWGWWAIVPLTLFWALLWPVALLWFVISWAGRYAALDKSPEAKAKRRAEWARLTREDAAQSKWSVSNVGIVCWSLCWLPLIPQGLVPIILTLSGSDVKALFIALYLPNEYKWPFMLAMVAIGAILLGVAIKNTKRR